MAVRDALIDLPHERYGEYLRKVYTEMAKHVPPHANIIEVGARHDRGVISREVIPHNGFVSVDKNPKRGDHTLDLLWESVGAEVIISTCVLHHTKEADIPRLLENLKGVLLMFSGPNAEVLPELFGDHEWHIDQAKLRYWLNDLGYDVEFQRIGMTEPYCELLVIAK